MRKNLLFIALLVIAISSNAQNMLLTDNNGTMINDDTITFVEHLHPDRPDVLYKHEGFMSIFNNTTDSMLIDLVRTEIMIIDSSTQDTHCWGTQCFAAKDAGKLPVWISNDPVKTSPMSTESYNQNGDTAIAVAVYIFPNVKFGTAIYKYTFTDLNEPSGVNDASIFVKWIIRNATSIEENALNNKFSIFPNPVKGMTTISFERAMTFKNQEVEVFNIIGERVKRVKIDRGASALSLNAENLVSGVYFVNIIANGIKVGSRKMIVK